MGQEGQIAGVVGQEGDRREPDGAGTVGARRARLLTREEMAGYRRARWQFLWLVGQEGRWQGAKWGRGSEGKEGQMAREGGMAGCRRARWQFLWVVGQEGGWQEARWGRVSGGKEGQMAGEGGGGSVQEVMPVVSRFHFEQMNNSWSVLFIDKLLGWWGQEGGWQGARWGGGKEGQMAGEGGEGMAKCRRARWQLLG